ncbi:polysaccharide biosynthesis/export family protein [bacterium]|nr:polysaccharide biosynthesis/export family protein [bacterium]
MLTSIFAACSATSPGSRTFSSEHGLRPGDVVEIRFDQYEKFDQTLIVYPDGKISLQAVGDIAVLGMTRLTLESLIRSRYEAILSSPQIDVEIIKASNLQIYMGGNLEKPGVVRFNGSLSLAQAILLAGGLKDPSHDHGIVVFRKQGKSGMRVHKFNHKARVPSDQSVATFMLAPYDVIFVTRSIFGNKSLKTLI